jgi:hypothetical protein
MKALYNQCCCFVRYFIGCCKLLHLSNKSFYIVLNMGVDFLLIFPGSVPHKATPADKAPGGGYAAALSSRGSSLSTPKK